MPRGDMASRWPLQVGHTDMLRLVETVLLQALQACTLMALLEHTALQITTMCCC